MSAWIVSETHIEALVCGAITYGISFDGAPVTPANATEVGRALLRENIRSVQYRYGDCRPYRADEIQYDEAGDWLYQYAKDILPGPVPTPDPDQFEFRGEVNLHPANLHQQIGCYDYQTCETPDFHETPAYRFCQDLIAAIEAEAGGEVTWRKEDPWGIDREEALYQRLKAKGVHQTLV